MIKLNKKIYLNYKISKKIYQTPSIISLKKKVKIINWLNNNNN